MPLNLKKHNPNSALLVEIDGEGKVVWAYVFKPGDEEEQINNKIEIHPESKAPTIMGAVLRTELAPSEPGGFGASGPKASGPRAPVQSAPQGGFGCHWVTQGGVSKCVPP